MVILKVLIISIILFLESPAGADIGLICTIHEERNEILKFMDVQEKVNKTLREFYKGLLDGLKVILVRSPMGKVNNAITAQLLASHFNVDMIISIGFAGAIDRSLKIGDVVLSTGAIQHDTGTIKPYGFIWEMSPEIGEEKDLDIDIERWALSNGYHYGTIVSGDQFIASEEKRDWLKKRFNALAVDMGAASIYEVCKQNGIKCIFIRIISDTADTEARINFNNMVRSERFRGVEVLRKFLREYRPRIRR